MKIGAIKNDIKSKCDKGVIAAGKEMADAFEESMNNFYAGYSPNRYVRTYGFDESYEPLIIAPRHIEVGYYEGLMGGHPHVPNKWIDEGEIFENSIAGDHGKPGQTVNSGNVYEGALALIGGDPKAFVIRHLQMAGL